jgi:hypothetical protein
MFSLLNIRSPKVESSEFGSDIIMGGEDDKTKVYDFVYENLSEQEIPVIIRVDRKIYLFSQTNIYRQLGNGLVYPCYQANNMYNTCEPGEKFVDGFVCPTDPPLPDGIKPRMKNVNENEKLFSFQNLINRRIIVSFDKFRDLLLKPKTSPICIGAIKTKRTVPSLAKLPFFIGVGALHCNAGAAEMETIWEIDSIKCNFTKEEEETLKENFTDIYGKAPPELSPPPPSSPAPSSNNDTVRTYSTVHTMSDFNSPGLTPYSDSSREPPYSDESIVGRPSNLEIPSPRELFRGSDSDSDSELSEDMRRNSAMDAVLSNAAHLREIQGDSTSPRNRTGPLSTESGFVDEDVSESDFQTPLSDMEMRINARSPVAARIRARSPSPFGSSTLPVPVRRRTSNPPRTPSGSPPPPPLLRRVEQPPRLPRTPPPPLRERGNAQQEPGRRDSGIWDSISESDGEEEVLAENGRRRFPEEVLDQSNSSLEVQSDDSSMV